MNSPGRVRRWRRGSTGPAREPRASGGQLGAALAAAGVEDRTARAGAHPQAEAVHLGAAAVVRLEGALAHWSAPLPQRTTTGALPQLSGVGGRPRPRSRAHADRTGGGGGLTGWCPASWAGENGRELGLCHGTRARQPRSNRGPVPACPRRTGHSPPGRPARPGATRHTAWIDPGGTCRTRPGLLAFAIPAPFPPSCPHLWTMVWTGYVRCRDRAVPAREVRAGGPRDDDAHRYRRGRGLASHPHRHRGHRGAAP